MKVLLFFLGIAIAGLAALFAIENSSVVSLSLSDFRSAQLPLFVWLAITFSAGLGSGLLLAIVLFFRAKTRERKTTKNPGVSGDKSFQLQKEHKYESKLD